VLIRYPGSKDRHLKFLREYIDPIAALTRSVVEPFAGTASITFDLLKRGVVDRYRISDVDESMVALWLTVRDQPEDLIKLVREYKPAVDDFYEFKEHPGEETLERAFRKVVLHQISYSGLGAAAGSPIGGRAQKSAYTVDCRWSPKRIEKGINECHTLLAGHDGVISAASWEETIAWAIDTESFIYLDPPYIEQGEKLYANGVIDHGALADTLHAARDFHAGWLISYDNAPLVETLYGSWAHVEGVDVRSHLHHKTITDAIVTPIGLRP
jgi:DNA adenine methylase